MVKKVQLSSEEYPEVKAIRRASKALTRLRWKIDPGQIPLDCHLKWTVEALDELADLLHQRFDIASGVKAPPSNKKLGPPKKGLNRPSRGV